MIDKYRVELYAGIRGYRAAIIRVPQVGAFRNESTLASIRRPTARWTLRAGLRAVRRRERRDAQLVRRRDRANAINAKGATK